MRPRLRAGVIFVVALLTFWAGFALGQEESEPNSYVFDMEYVAKGHSLHVNLNQWLNQASFDKETDFGGRDIIRGLIPAGAEEKDYIGYAWGVGTGKLYIDLNRNRDLTDDPNGVFETDRRGQSSYFEDVRFTVKVGSLEVPYVAHIGFNGPGFAYMNVRSGFGADMELYGESWCFYVVDNMNGNLGAGDYLSVAKDEKLRSQLSRDSLPIRKKFFFGGHLYDAISMVAIALENIDEGLSTTEARAQVRDQLEQITGFAGTGGVFTMTTQDHLGMAPGSLALIKIVDGEWTSLR